MNTAYVNEFLVFCKTMNYSEAARELFISRSTLRDHIQELEFELGVPLLDKSDEGPRITIYGKQFIPRARELCRFSEDLVQEFRDMRDNYLNVRVSYSALCWLKMLLLRARKNVVSAHPGKIIDIVTVSSAEVSRDAIDNGIVDLSIQRLDKGESPEGLPQFEGLGYLKVGESPIRFFTGTANPLARIPQPTMADLKGQTLLVSEDLMRVYRERNDTPDVFGMELATMEFNDFAEYYMADYSHCVGTVPERLIDEYQLRERDDCVLLDLQDLHVVSDFYLICSREFLANPTAALLFQEMDRLLAKTSL